MCVQYYFGFYLSAANWLDWMAKTDALYKSGQSCLYFIRSLASFNICKELRQMFYQTVMASALFFAVVCWGSSISKRDATWLDILASVADGRTLSRFLSIMDSPLHPLNSAISRQRSCPCPAPRTDWGSRSSAMHWDSLTPPEGDQGECECNGGWGISYCTCTVLRHTLYCTLPQHRLWQTTNRLQTDCQF